MASYHLFVTLIFDYGTHAGKISWTSHEYSMKSTFLVPQP